MNIEDALKSLPEHFPAKFRLVTIFKMQELQPHELIRVIENKAYNTSQTQGIVNYRSVSKLINVQNEE
jgi:hypothetical protein